MPVSDRVKDVWVPGDGPVPCPVMLVGEAPAREEGAQGCPFVGPSGKEVDVLLSKFLGLKRSSVYVTNLLKTPLYTKPPLSPAVLRLMGELLSSEIEEVDPSLIISVGALSTHWFLGDDYDMETLSATPHLWRGRVVIPAFHPAAAFRKPERLSWTQQAFRMARWALDHPSDIRSSAALHDVDAVFDTKFILDCDASLSLFEEWIGLTIAVDTETYSDGTPFLVSATSTPGSAIVFRCNAPESPALRRFRSLLSDSSTITVLHNALFDLPVLAAAGIFPARFVDTMVMAFLLQFYPLSLKSLAYKLCGVRMKEYSEMVGNARDLSVIPLLDASRYAASDADFTLRVYYALKVLAYPGVEHILDTDMGIVPMLVQMMRRGIRLDIPFLSNLESEFFLRNLETLDAIQNITGFSINPASAPQVADILYNKLGLGKGLHIRHTKWGGTTESKTLERLRASHPIVSLIIEWRQIDTLIDKYLNVLPRMAGMDGRIHTKISLTRVKHSGRLASSNPNLMAQPVRTRDGARIRDAFVASEGYTLISFDYNQIEMRMMAHLSADPVMLQVYREGGDIHTDTAMRAFGIANPADVDEMEHRYPAKRTGFGIINLITAEGLARELAAGGASGWSVSACQELLDAWFSVHPGVKHYFEAVYAEVRRYGFVSDIWGRREMLGEVSAAAFHLREGGLRKACNQKIQAGAQGIIKRAMMTIWETHGASWAREGLAFPLLQIHDDLLWEAHISVLPLVVDSILPIMRNAASLSIPIVVNVKVGQRWGSLEKWKE